MLVFSLCTNNRGISPSIIVVFVTKKYLFGKLTDEFDETRAQCSESKNKNIYPVMHLIADKELRVEKS